MGEKIPLPPNNNNNQTRNETMTELEKRLNDYLELSKKFNALVDMIDKDWCIYPQTITVNGDMITVTYLAIGVCNLGGEGKFSFPAKYLDMTEEECKEDWKRLCAERKAADNLEKEYRAKEARRAEFYKLKAEFEPKQ